MRDAACNVRDADGARVYDPDLWFPGKGASSALAKRICFETCPVRMACLEGALSRNERFGIWGGLSDNERRRVKRRARGDMVDALVVAQMLPRERQAQPRPRGPRVSPAASRAKLVAVGLSAAQLERLAPEGSRLDAETLSRLMGGPPKAWIYSETARRVDEIVKRARQVLADAAAAVGEGLAS